MYFYEVKVSYERHTGEDNPSIVKEVYLIDSTSPADAESKLLAEIKPLMWGDYCEILSIKRRSIFEIVPHENEGEIWYEARVEMITIDGDQETRKAVVILVEHRDFDYALQLLHTTIGSYDCEIVGLKKSAIIEVLRS